MGTISYLVNPENKTMFEMGKSFFWNDIEIFKWDLLINELGDQKDTYYINDKNLLYFILLTKKFKDWFDTEEKIKNYSIIKSKELFIFCDDKLVYLTQDTCDTYIELIRDHGYKIVGSVYENFEE